jgi:DNA-binding response OmpR family regulator
MNFFKKILLVHGDAKARRTLTLLFAGAGYDVRSYGRADVSLEAARSEWFDLAVVADPLPEIGSFELVGSLKKIQPSVAVLLLVNQLELPSVIKGIRLAVADVLAPGGDWTSVMQRVNSLLRPDGAPAPAELTPEELAEVEAILARVDTGRTESGLIAAASAPSGALREELERLARERDEFRKTAERLAQEKTARDAAVQSQQVQHADLARLQDELSALRSEHEVVTAAQSAVDAKARALSAAREDLSRERAALAAERAEGLSSEEATRIKSMEEIARERETMDDLRLDLHSEDVRLREEASKVQQSQSRLEAERRQLQEDVELLQEQEANLRAYEQRLRSLTAAVEADRVNQAAPRPSRDPFARDPSLDEAWNKVNRASDLLEAEHRSFNDEKMVLNDEKIRLEEWEARLKKQEAQLAEPSPEAGRPSFTREPFKAAKAMFSPGKK